MSVIQRKYPVPKSLNLLMVEHELESKGISIVVSLGYSKKITVPGHCLSWCLFTCSHNFRAQLLPYISIQPASLTTRGRHFTKQQWSRHQDGFFFSLPCSSTLPLPPFFKKHHHSYTYVILVFYGLKMTHSRGGVSCTPRHAASRKSLPMCICTPPAPRPPPHAHATTSMVMGVLTIDTAISTATTS